MNETLCHSANLWTPQQPAGILAPDFPELSKEHDRFLVPGLRQGPRSRGWEHGSALMGRHSHQAVFSENSKGPAELYSVSSDFQLMGSLPLMGTVTRLQAQVTTS